MVKRSENLYKRTESQTSTKWDNNWGRNPSTQYVTEGLNVT